MFGDMIGPIWWEYRQSCAARYWPLDDRVKSNEGPDAAHAGFSVCDSDVEPAFGKRYSSHWKALFESLGKLAWEHL